jgi:hypothetical protein
MVTTLETDKKALFLNQGTFLKPGDRREQGSKRTPHMLIVELLRDDPMRLNEMRADTEVRR